MWMRSTVATDLAYAVYYAYTYTDRVGRPSIGYSYYMVPWLYVYILKKY